jgi:WD40 repeat protein
VNWVYFTPHVGETNDFPEAFPRLLEAIRMDQEHLLMHTRILLRAQEWETNDRDSSFKLSGMELKEAEAWQAVAGEKDPPPTKLHNEYIFASRDAQNNRLRRTLIGVSVALVLSVGLALVATYFLVQSQLLNEEVESLLWSNHAQQVMADGDNLLSVQLARQAVESEHEGGLSLLSFFPMIEVEPPPLSQRTLSTVSYLPGARQRLDDHTASVWAVDSYGSLNGDWRAVSGDADGTVNIWNLQDDRPASTLLGSHDNSVWAVAMNSDGTRAVSASADGTLSLWDTVMLVNHWTVETPSIIWSAGFSADGEYVVTGDLDGVLTLRAADTGQVLDTLEIHNGAVWTLAISPVNNLIASGGAGGVVHISQIQGGNLLDLPRSQKVNTGPEQNAVWSLTFNDDGQFLAAGLADRRIIIWDVQRFRQIDVLEGHTDRVISLAFSPSTLPGALVSGSADGDVFVWNVAQSTLERRFRSHEGAIWSLDFSPDARRMVSGSADSDLIIWDRFSGAQRGDQTRFDDSITALAVAARPDRNTGQSYIAAGTRSGSIYLVAPDEDPVLLDRLSDDISGLAFNPVNPNQLAAGSLNAILSIWDNPARLSRPNTYQGHRDRIWSVDYHSSGEYIVTGSADQSAIIWRVGNASPLVRLTNNETISNGHLDDVLSAVFVPGRSTLTVLTGSADNRLLLWELDSENNVTAPLELMRPDIPEDNPPHENDVQALAVSSDGRFALSGGADDTLLLWNLDSGQFVAELASEHTDDITDIVFIPPGTANTDPAGEYLVVTTGTDGRVLTWELSDFDHVEPLRAYQHETEILTLAYDPLAQSIYTGSDTGYLTAWRFDTLPQLLEWIHANRRADPLTPEECQRYSPEPDSDCRQIVIPAGFGMDDTATDTESDEVVQ